MSMLVIPAGAVLALVFIVWLGLSIPPKPFPPPAFAPGPVKTVPLPGGLPEPVRAHFARLYGNEIPVVDTVIITGRGRMRPFGVWLPVRFVIVHRAGWDYRHYFEATFFGLPFLKVNEGILDGRSFFESPMGEYHDDPNTNQGANMALWAEAAWFPSVWLTHPRAHWSTVDNHSALLSFPHEDEGDTLLVRFNASAGRVDMMEGMRFRAPEDRERTLWIASLSDDGSVSYATWLDDGRPWAAFTVEQMIINADVGDYIGSRGP
jgi:hypothetical protein